MTDKANTGGSTVQLEDPLQAGPQPPYPEQQQEMPGTEAQMQPRPEHGEETYPGGSGRLANLKALVTGADCGIGKAVSLAFEREGAYIDGMYLNDYEDECYN